MSASWLAIAKPLLTGQGRNTLMPVMSSVTVSMLRIAHRATQTHWDPFPFFLVERIPPAPPSSLLPHPGIYHTRFP